MQSNDSDLLMNSCYSVHTFDDCFSVANGNCLDRRTCIICNVDGGPKIGTTWIHKKILPPFAHIVNLVSRRDLLHQKYITGNLGSCDHCNLLVLTPLSPQISASKFQNLSQIPLKIRGGWKIVVFDLKLTRNLKTHSKFRKLAQIFGGQFQEIEVVLTSKIADNLDLKRLVSWC